MLITDYTEEEQDRKAFRATVKDVLDAPHSPEELAVKILVGLLADRIRECNRNMSEDTAADYAREIVGKCLMKEAAGGCPVEEVTKLGWLIAKPMSQIQKGPR